MSRITLLAVAPATLAAFMLVGCSEPAPAPDPHSAEIARLARAVEELTASNSALDAEIRRQGRQLAGMGRERAAREHASREPAVDEGLAKTIATAVGDEDAPGAATPTDANTASAEVMDALLASDAGKEAIAKATKREIEEREAKERRLYVSYQVGMFAQKAGLDERQTESLQQIWKRSMDGGVELRKQFAAINTLPEAQRETARAAAMETMRDLGRTRRDEVAELLSGEQLEMYGKAEEEIVGGLHGGSRR